MRTITVVTGARSDYGIYQPLLERIESDPELQLDLIVTGMHLCPEFGNTVQEIERDGYAIRDRVEMLLAADSPEGIGKATGLGVIGFAQAYARHRPEMLLVLGDRFEMLSAVLAAQPFNIPIAHIHGGESTAGAMDEGIRHAITKMSHVHFPATEAFAARIRQMGEDPQRVIVSGAPALDALQSFVPLTESEFRSQFRISLTPAPIAVTFHPVTREYEQTEHQIEQLIAALERVDCPIVITYPNADTNGRKIIEAIDEFAARKQNVTAVANLGHRGYFTLMRSARAMVGNSSSGIIEAASFRLPVVDIGTRQQGRPRSSNVIHCGYPAEEIAAALATALSAEFRSSLASLKNSYGDGNAAERIANCLKRLPIDGQFLHKTFHDSPQEVPVAA